MKPATINVPMDHQYAFDVLHLEVEHGKKDWLRIAAQALAKQLLEDGCVVTHSTYRIDRCEYHTSFTVLVGRPPAKLP